MNFLAGWPGGKKPRATLRVINETHFETEDLRAIALKCREREFGKQPKKLVVTFRMCKRNSRGCHGLGNVNGSRSWIWIPRETPDPQEVAHVVCHEFAHNGGAKGERWMRRSKRYGFAEGWRDTVAFAAGMPIRLAPPKAKPAAPTLLEHKLEAIDARQRAWTTKAKRAATALKKLVAARKRIERRLAAMKGGDQ